MHVRERHALVAVSVITALVTAVPSAAVATGRLGASSVAVPTVSIGDVAVAPSAAARQTVLVPISLDTTHAVPASVGYHTVSGTAVAGTNFVATHGTVTFKAAAQVQISVAVTLLPGSVPPSGEAFTIVLSAPKGATLGAIAGTVQLLATPWHSPFVRVGSHGALPLLSVGDAAVFSGETGPNRSAAIPITLSVASASTVTFRLTTLSDTAVAGIDFRSTSVPITIRTPSVETFVKVPVTPTTAVSPNRQFLVQISLVHGAAVTRGTGHVELLSRSPGSIVTALSTSYTTIPLSANRNSHHVYDTFSVLDASGVVTSKGSAQNVAGNTRLLFWKSAAASTLDQESCSTWSSQSPPNGTANIVQEGVSLRVSTSAGVTRAITVLKNVFDYGNGSFFVALWDTQIPKNGFISLGLFNLSHVFGQPGKQVPFPWSMCARVTGSVVQFVVWPDTISQPAWGDANYGGTVTIPTADEGTWGQPGVPGWYVGHLGAGQSATYTALSTMSLP